MLKRYNGFIFSSRISATVFCFEWVVDGFLTLWLRTLLGMQTLKQGQTEEDSSKKEVRIHYYVGAIKIEAIANNAVDVLLASPMPKKTSKIHALMFLSPLTVTYCLNPS